MADSDRVRVAVDALGGDHAPAEIVAGAAMAASQGLDVIVVGPVAEVRAVLRASAGTVDIDDSLMISPAGGRIELIHTTDAVGMEEDAALVLRSKPRASIRVAAELLRDGKADAIVSAGSTGATLAASLLTLGRLPGVRRPVVAVVLPLPRREIVLVDAGGSMDIQPEAVPGYARMGMAYAEVRGTDQPRVGLLNVGEEPGKGSLLAKQAYSALSELPAFAGNVEPAAVLRGDVDVVVTDGFTGNIFLKTLEAMASSSRGGGAALLLGVAGDVLVAHGAARGPEVATAIRTAADVARARLSQRLGALLQPLA